MKFISNLLSSLLLATWIGAIAIFSIQNIQEISLQFLNFSSIAIPIGVLLALSVGIGMSIGAILPLFWQKSASQEGRRQQPSSK
jgi:lipopolysaccharide assembly protein A